MKHHVFVLSGGSIRGAFQVGVLQAILERLSNNDTVAGLFGVSVGALNIAFMSDHLGSRGLGPASISDLRDSGLVLEKFWLEKVTGPGSLVHARSADALAQSILAQNGAFTGWKGLVDFSPLSNLFKAIVTTQRIQGLSFPVQVGYTDYVSGEYHHKDLRSLDTAQGLWNYVFASSVTPLIMDYLRFPVGDRFVRLSDGGLRHVIPTQEVQSHVASLITTGIAASDIEVHIIVCSAGKIGTWTSGDDDLGATSTRPGMLDMIDRAFTMMTQSVVNADIYFLREEMKKVGADCNIYQSPTEYLTNSIVSFTGADVRSMIARGQQVGAGTSATPSMPT